MPSIFSKLANEAYFHNALTRLRRTIGPVIIIPTASPTIVNKSWLLLKSSLRTSNCLLGARYVKNVSSPYANTREVDSSNAGAVMIVFIPRIYIIYQ